MWNDQCFQDWNLRDHSLQMKSLTTTVIEYLPKLWEIVTYSPYPNRRNLHQPKEGSLMGPYTISAWHLTASY